MLALALLQVKGAQAQVSGSKQSESKEEERYSASSERRQTSSQGEPPAALRDIAAPDSSSDKGERPSERRVGKGDLPSGPEGTKAGGVDLPFTEVRRGLHSQAWERSLRLLESSSGGKCAPLEGIWYVRR